MPSNTPAQRRYNTRRAQAVIPRRQRVEAAYLAGATYDEMAEEHGVSSSVISQDIQWLRRQGRCSRRKKRLEERISAAEIAEICDLWNRQRLSSREIGQGLGWSKPETDAVIVALRGRGYDLPERRGRAVQVHPEDPRQIKREVGRRKRKDASSSGRRMYESRKAILRILGACERPLAAAEIHRFLTECGERVSKQAVRNRLLRAERDALVARARPEQRHYFERGAGRWFIPVGAEQSTESLTLADAERETELARLIESQQDELQRGEWIDSEKGHWADKSIDAPLTADGFTILDTLGDEDEALQELIGEPA